MKKLARKYLQKMISFLNDFIAKEQGFPFQILEVLYKIS